MAAFVSMDPWKGRVIESLSRLTSIIYVVFFRIIRRWTIIDSCMAVLSYDVQCQCFFSQPNKHLPHTIDAAEQGSLITRYSVFFFFLSHCESQSKKDR